jgi:outer membrane protein
MKELIMIMLSCMPFLSTAQSTNVTVATSEPKPQQKVVVQQKPLFGYFSQKEVLNAMSDKAIADKNLSTLKGKYDQEMKNSEDEFNRRYQEFLDGQRSFAEPILRKRQAELQMMMEHNVAFKDEARRLLKEAERDIYAPLKQKIRAAAAKVGNELGLAFIINTDNDNLPFADSSRGVDITSDMKEMLK